VCAALLSKRGSVVRINQLISVAVLLLGSSAALAGLVQPAPVSVTLFSTGGGRATGDMVTARFSKDSVAFLGCGVRRIYSSDGSFGVFGFCEARTSGGVVGTCFSEDPALIEALASISDYSFIVFTWDASGTCTSIGNSTQSVYLPDK
jgi:hypothetical protein